MYFALARAGRLSETAQTPRAWSLPKNRASIRAGKHGWPCMFVPMGLYRDGMEVANQGKDEPFQLPVFALFACAGGSGSVKPEAISFSRSRSDSPTPANTCAQVFAGVGESLRERLKEIASGFRLPEPPTRAKSANTGS